MILNLKTLHITKEEIQNLPAGGYEGEIVLVETLEQCKVACKEILTAPYCGFDTETRPSFKKGVHYPVALIQIAIEGKVFIFFLHKLGFPLELKKIFTSRKLVKVGIAIRDDVKDLRKLLPFLPASFIELTNLTKELEIVNAGAQGLTALFLGIRISKSQQRSNWAAYPLTTAQIKYAATDAWLCLEIYKILEQGGYNK